VKFGNYHWPNGRRGSAGFTRSLLWPAARTIIPLRVWQSLSRVSLLIPYYHMVSEEEVPHVRHLYRYRNTGEFERDLDFLLDGFVPVGLTEIVAHLNDGGNLPRRCFHVTFDDGFREMHEVVAPVLSKKGVPATFFLNSAFLDQGGMAHHNQISLLLDRLTQPLSKGTLQELESLLPVTGPATDLRTRLLAVRYADRQVLGKMAAIAAVDFDGYVAKNRPYLSTDQVFDLIRQGFSIGAHSVDHPLYADLLLDEQVRQTRESMNFIVNRFAVETRAFAFPHTDSGVGPEFFQAVISTGLVDICFGTGGLLRHFHPANLERFSIEKNAHTMRAAVTREYARAAYGRLRGN
jgi:peptidoglycan/xylan/chitin deacetylase (PgdA/CDA1 family)